MTDLQSLAISGHTADEMTAELERMAAQQRDIMQHVHSTSEQTFLEAVTEAYKNLFRPDTSLKTDWKQFNDVLGGLQRGCLYIIAARPVDGKKDFYMHCGFCNGARVVQDRQITARYTPMRRNYVEASSL